MAFAANTSPPPLLILTTISGTAPSASNSSVNCRGVTSSPHHVSEAMSPYRISSGASFSSAAARNVQKCLFFGWACGLLSCFCPTFFYLP